MKKLVAVITCVSFLMGGCTTGTALAQPSATGSGETTSGSELGELPEEPTIVLEEVETPVLERNTSETARTLRIESGATAPYSGLLLNDEAAAFVLAEMEAFESRVSVALETQREMDLARLHLEVGELRLQITSDRERFSVILEGRDREITRLMELNEHFVEQSNAFPWESVLVGLGGLVLGLLGGFVFGVIAAD